MVDPPQFESDLARFLQALAGRGGRAVDVGTGRPLGITDTHLTRVRHELLRRGLIRQVTTGGILELTTQGIDSIRGQGSA
jgi:hypothetical protein